MKLIPPSNTTAFVSPVPRIGARERAIQAAIEREYCHYISLECGHKTTIETDQSYALWRPKRSKSMCETCGKWVERVKKKHPRVKDETEPLF